MKVLQKYTAALVVTALGLAAFAPQSHAQVDGELGYKKGLYYESPDGMFKIKQNFRIQFRADFVDKTDKDLETDFMIRRMKLKYGGHAFEEWLKFGFQLAGSVGRDAGEDDLEIEDAFLVFAKNPMADVKVGRYKVPYEREVLNSSSALQFVDRSIAKELVIDTNRADGISVGGIFGNMLAYRMGVFQYDGEKFSSGDNILLAGRIQANICCGTLKYSSGSFTASGDYKIAPNFAKVPTFSIGIGGFVDTGADRTAAGTRLPASGTALLGRTIDDSSTIGFTADFAAGIERASFEAAFYYGKDKRAVIRNASLGADDALGGTGADEDTEGFAGTESDSHIAYRLQAGFMLTPDFEAALRWAAVDYDKDSNEGDERAITFGLNYYLAGHRAKLQVDYSNINTDNPSGKDIKENTVRAQVQLYL